MSDWKFITKKSKYCRLAFCTYTKWRYLGFPAWSWIHSFYYYPDKKVLQITILGLNLGLRFNSTL